jgi:hypothetical protein
MSSNLTTCPSSPIDADEWLENCMHEQMAEISMDFKPTVFSTDPPQPTQLQEVAGPSNSPEFLPLVFTETPFSQPTPLVTHPAPQGAGATTTPMPTMDTLAGGAGHPPSPKFFPPGKKLLKKVPLHESSDLSIFDILNTFHCHWFLSVDSLRAQALSAQKAKDGKKFGLSILPSFTHTWSEV